MRERLAGLPWLRLMAWLLGLGTLVLVGWTSGEELSQVAQAHPAVSSAPAGEASALPRPPATNRSPCPEPSDQSKAKRVVLNLASSEQLTRLPGIGRKRAEAIIRLRQRLGKFRSLRDLLRIRGFGWRMLRRIRPFVALDPTPAKTTKRKSAVKKSAIVTKAPRRAASNRLRKPK